MLHKEIIKPVVAVMLGLLLPMLAVDAARGEGRIFWVDTEEDRILSIDTAGSGPITELPAKDLPADASYALDYSSEQNRFYYTLTYSSANPHQIGWTSGDGSGRGGLFDTGSLAPATPTGVAVDPLHGRVWWANWDGPGIMSADQDGGDEATFLSTILSAPNLLIDPIGKSVYWNDSDYLFQAPVDGSLPPIGLNPGSATTSSPRGFALDRRQNRLYWANWSWDQAEGDEAIGWVATDGSGSGDLDPGTQAFGRPTGVIIDPLANRIYWMSALDSTDAMNTGIYWRDLGDPGIHGAINNLGASYQPGSPLLIRAPVATADPVIAGGTATGTELSCNGTWEENHSEARFFMAPAETEHTWLRDGQTIPGETGSTITARQLGEYRCVEKVANPGGMAEASSPVHVVDEHGPTGPTGPDTVCPASKLDLRLSGFRPPKPHGTGPHVMGVRVRMRVGADVTARIRPRIRYRTRSGVKRTVKLKQRTVRIRGARNFRFVLPRKARRQLQRPVRGKRVNVIMKARLNHRTADPHCRQDPVTRRLKTRVVGISKRVGLRRIGAPGA